MDRITPPEGPGAVKAGDAAVAVVGPDVLGVMADRVDKAARVAVVDTEAADIAAIARASSRKVKGSSRDPWTIATAMETAARVMVSSTVVAELQAGT